MINRMIDDTDHKILALLQQNSQLSNVALAEQVGLTTSTVHERVKKLERKGIIKRYVAIVDPQALGKQITAFIRLTVGIMPGSYIEAKNSVAAICQQEPDILECHSVAGEDCYILKVRVASPQALEKLLENIRVGSSVASSTTSIVLSTLKEDTLITPV